MRLIDADVMREYWLKNGENEYVYDTNAFLDSIDNQPTIDTVRHGHWERIGLQGMIELFECSECGFVASILSGYSKFSFCPECAAKMDLQE